jgi:hypothetical protein
VSSASMLASASGANRQPCRISFGVKRTGWSRNALASGANAIRKQRRRSHRTTSTLRHICGRRWLQRVTTNTTGGNGDAPVAQREESELPPAPTSSATTPSSDLSQEEQALLLRRAQAGDSDALKRLFQAMLEEPDLGAQALDLPRRVREELIAATYGDANDLARTLHVAKAAMVEATLLREAGASALEQLLIERIATCWLSAELADIDAATREEHHAPGQYADYYARRQDRAHRRFLQAVEALARMRRLLSPLPLVGQVNIAEAGTQQLNVAAMTPMKKS